MPLDPVLSAESLSKLARRHPLVLLDARTGPGAQAAYAKSHLAGAFFADLETELSGPKGDPAQGGRHPLPSAADFAQTVGRWGVTPNTHVVVYDEQNGANAAARLWWMLRALGHTQVQVLDGGLQAALNAGFPADDRAPHPVEGNVYPSGSWLRPTVDIDEVERARKASDWMVLDVRARARYEGVSEPIDPVAGHIPGAHNVPLTENLTPEGRFKSSEALRALYEPLLAGLDPSRLIVHCGSGVTACHTLLALDRAGLKGARLYVGSWSEWCRQPGRERAP